MSVPVGSRHSFPVSSEVELADARGSKSAAERALEADAAAAQRRHEAELAGLRLEAPLLPCGDELGDTFFPEDC